MKNWLLILLLIIAGALFVERAFHNGREVNTKISRTDQGAYIKYGIALRDSDFQHVGARNRMPLYPSFLALFMDKGEKPADFFERGKRINTFLALAVLIGVGLVFWRTFPRHLALNGLFFAAFSVFLFKAPHVQAEVLYYGLTFAVFLLFWQLFRRPNFLLAVAAGGLLGLAHLTKASVLPGLAVFVVFYPLDALWRVWRRGEKPWPRLGVAAVTTVVFLAVISPYLIKSKEIYGHYFYNVNSTFYIWCDSWDEAEAKTKAAGDRKGWPDLPPEEIPSLKNYLRTHTAADMGERVATGISRVFKSSYAYGYIGLCLAWLAFCAYVAWHRRRLLWRLVRNRPVPIVALAAYFVGYYLLIAWYAQIIQGNRFVLGLFLPFVFTVSIFAASYARRLWFPSPGGRRIDALTAFNTLFSLWLAVEIIVTCAVRIPAVYGGM